MIKLSKRSLLGAPLLAPLLAAQTLTAQSQPVPAQDDPVANLPQVPGAFRPTAESLRAYTAPDWFRDAKFGIWAHWGPQAVPRQGDWYARFMYVPGHPHYDHHLKTYGHPSEFGYKDIIPLWTAEKWDPEGLMDLYVRAGAKYFVSMGCHHDNFELWASQKHRWNVAAMGPKRDVVGAWQTAARARGLKFGVSEHLGASYAWFAPSHGYDQFWPRLGVDYDGADPQHADLYHPKHDEPYRGGDTWYAKNPAWHREWFDRISDLTQTYLPDLLYTDGALPFGDVGRTMLANYYNAHAGANGRNQAVYTSKSFSADPWDGQGGTRDVERGVMKGINPAAWQTDTSIGDWFYSDGYAYKTTDQVVHMLADIVSKNGNLLLNVVLYPDGSLPPESRTFLDEMAAWMAINGEAIHGTRPWHTYGEGPTETAEGAFREDTAYTAQDIRFTTKGKALYAITLGQPKGDIVITELGRKAGKVKRVELLGGGRLVFRQEDKALVVTAPDVLPTRHGSALRIAFA